VQRRKQVRNAATSAELADWSGCVVRNREPTHGSRRRVNPGDEVVLRQIRESKAAHVEGRMLHSGMKEGVCRCRRYRCAARMLQWRPKRVRIHAFGNERSSVEVGKVEVVEENVHMATMPRRGGRRRMSVGGQAGGAAQPAAVQQSCEMPVPSSFAAQCSTARQSHLRCRDAYPPPIVATRPCPSYHRRARIFTVEGYQKAGGIDI